MKLKANRPLTGTYGSVNEGDTFDTDEQTAAELMKRGLAEPAHEKHKPESKAVENYENKAVKSHHRKS